MNIDLTGQEARVLGTLIEKEKATPDYYPLTLNSLINACNQKTNRDPVVSFDEDTVTVALSSLREKNLVRKSNVSRVEKYEQIFSTSLNLIAREEAIICILLLRGPQTLGEIRGRTERLYSFQDLDEVKKSITSLEDMALLRKMPRQPGQKESRYTHLLSGESDRTLAEPADSQETGNDVPHPLNSSSGNYRNNDDDRILEMQEQMDNMRKEIEQLKEDFASFKSQFE